MLHKWTETTSYMRVFYSYVHRCILLNLSLPSTGLHPANGSPEKPSSQEQIGWWFCTMHRALNPQEPTHGLTQVPARQASARGQSWSMTHWGRQVGGAPSVPSSQAHTARLPSLRHVECGPHGDGVHGFCSGAGVWLPVVMKLYVS